MTTKDALAELAAMKASGQLTDAEYTAARDIIFEQYGRSEPPQTRVQTTPSRKQAIPVAPSDASGHITIGKIVSWSIGLFCMAKGIAGLGAVNPMASQIVPPLLISTLLLPPLRTLFHKITGNSLSSGVRILCVVLFAGISMSQIEPRLMPAGLSAAMRAQDGATPAQTAGIQPASTAARQMASAVAPSRSEDDLAVTGIEFIPGEGRFYYLTGHVTNNTGRQYSYVQVQFNLYDADGVQVGSTMDNVNNLEAGGQWNFKALVTEENVARARLKGIDKF